MTAQLAIRFIRPRHHRQGIPAHDRRQALFNPQVSRVGTLPIQADRVPIGRKRLHMRVDTERLGELLELLNEIQPPLWPSGRDHGTERFKPLLRFLRIGIGAHDGLVLKR